MTETILDIPSLRKALKITQAQLAVMAGVNLSTVWRWENDGVPERGPARAFLLRLNQEARAMEPTITSVLSHTDENRTHCGESGQCVPAYIHPDDV